ncbi:hypothetical protein B0H16DRAFT_1462208 [Mycena metata]|uniref:Uncharacterized protein n=1 Tax=Mycena metata TaxID=1033252 RepID=A0AAD7IPR6_9AGAR|nr:hypothetical protein B0H16DRAFT_1462208 [Mycena metata]
MALETQHQRDRRVLRTLRLMQLACRSEGQRDRCTVYGAGNPTPKGQARLAHGSEHASDWYFGRDIHLAGVRLPFGRSFPVPGPSVPPTLEKRVKGDGDFGDRKKLRESRGVAAKARWIGFQAASGGTEELLKAELHSFLLQTPGLRIVNSARVKTLVQSCVTSSFAPAQPLPPLRIFACSPGAGFEWPAPDLKRMLRATIHESGLSSSCFLLAGGFLNVVLNGIPGWLSAQASYWPNAILFRRTAKFLEFVLVQTTAFSRCTTLSPEVQIAAICSSRQAIKTRRAMLKEEIPPTFRMRRGLVSAFISPERARTYGALQHLPPSGVLWIEETNHDWLELHDPAAISSWRLKIGDS